MDPFRLLSRSSNLSKTGNRAKFTATKNDARASTHAPANQSANSSAESKSRKRKRGVKTLSSHENGAVDASLDFFGAPSSSNNANSHDKSQPSRNGQKENGDEEQAMAAEESREPIKELNIEESREVLRANKIKIVRLWSPESEAAKTKKTTKAKAGIDSAETVGTEDNKKAHKADIVPQPLVSFGQLRPRYMINTRLASNIEALGFKKPTEVQLASLPLLLEPHRTDSTSEPTSLLSVAPTGSGKTLAFLIPTLNGLLKARNSGEDISGPRAVVLAPTKELAWQIVNEAKKLALQTGIKATLMKKGMHLEGSGEALPAHSSNIQADDDEDSEDSYDSEESSSNSMNGASTTKQKSSQPPVKSAILVSTPMTLLNALTSSNPSTPPHLPSITTLILDEADSLLDPLFRDQTLALISACTHPRLQLTLWSATMGSNIEALATSLVKTRRSPLPLTRLVVGIKDAAVAHIRHRLIYAATEHGKLTALRDLLRPSSRDASPLRPPFLVFTQTIPRAIALRAELAYDIPPAAGGPSRLAVLHAELSPAARARIMASFRTGDVWILITTDVLARGVDFAGLNGVVNYDFPQSAAAYVHRAGRAGRAGRPGVALTLYAAEDVPFVRGVVNVITTALAAHGRVPDPRDIPVHLRELRAPSKRAKKELKRRGIASRRTGATVESARLAHKGRKSSHHEGEGEGKGDKARKLTKTRISTKSGFDRRRENRRREMGRKGAGTVDVAGADDGDAFAEFE